MKWTLLLLLGLASCHGQQTEVVRQSPAWAAAVADQLYQRQVLSAAGRDSLKQRIAARQLSASYSVPGSETTYPYRATDAATVLAFCVDAFEQEGNYRAGFGDSLMLAAKQPQRFARALRQAGGDSAAAWQLLLPPAMRLEEKIASEDQPMQDGWTIFPPVRPVKTVHLIANTRSISGKTRTRTARDLYEVGLLTEPQYQVVRREVDTGKLLIERQVCARAAQLALDAAVRPVRQHSLDTILTNLRRVGVLTAAGRQQALADSQVCSSFRLFEVLPHCAHAKVLNLHALPRAPLQLYPRLLAEVAAICPAFRYASVRVALRERDLGDMREELVELSFTASGRRYTDAFTQGFQRKDGRNAYSPTGAEVSSQFIASINQWLRDQHAAERLYLAYTPDEQAVHGSDRLGLLLLTARQRLAWGEESNFLQTTDEADEQASLFTSEYIEAALALYQRLGLFRGLTAAELAAGRREALGGGAKSYVAVLQGFPHLLVATGGESAELPQAYARAVAEVAAVTRGAFRPVHVRDSFTGQQARGQPSSLSFECGARHYRAKLLSDLGWMDAAFAPLVERAVRENTHGGRLYLLAADESNVYVFLTAVQAAAIRAAQPTFFALDSEASGKE